VVASYGRLMFPAVAAIAVLLVFGWRAIHRKLDKIMVALVGLIALAAPFWLLGPAFSLPDTVTAAGDLDSTGLFFGPAEQPIAELLSADVFIESSEEGATIPVELCWRVMGQSDRPISVLVHFIGPDNLLGANRRSYPGMGSYATTFWEPGQTFCDVMPVLVYHRTLPDSYLYRVEVAMLDLESEERLPIFDGVGNQITFAVVDEVQLLLGEEREERIAYEPDQEADSPPIQLISYEFEDVWQQGDVYPVVLNWGINRAVDQDYQVFVHLRDASSGEVVAQADGPPAGGWHPTSWWKLGLGVADEHRVDVPDNVPPGEYHLVVGFYDLASGVRFGPEYDLGLVTVVE
jgi:hypothetical protein